MSEHDIDLGQLVTEVATRLAAGDMPAAAWAKAGERYGLSGCHADDSPVPIQLRELADAGQVPRRQRILKTLAWQARPLLPARWRRRIAQQIRIDDHARAALPAAIAACRLTHHTGAPLADILHACAAGLTEAAEAHTIRSQALAGPISSARVLSALPALGMMLGAGIGVDVWAIYTDGSLGTAAALLGLAAYASGWWWSRILITRAQRQGS